MAADPLSAGTLARQAVPLTPLAWLGFAAVAVLAWTSENGTASLVTLLLAPVLARTLWRRNEPPVLVFAILAQWVAVGAHVLYANLHGDRLTERGGGQPELEAVYLSLLGLTALAAGMRLVLAGMPATPAGAADEEARLLSIERCLLLYVAMLVVGLALQGATWRIPRLTQIALALFELKWVVVFVLARVALAQRRGYAALLAVVAVEVVIGFSGFFSGFKQVFFVLAIAYLAARPVVDARQAAVTTALIASVLALAVVWMSVRDEYRQFINAGGGQQVVVVPFEDRMQRLAELVSALEPADLEEGADRLIARVAYVDMFAHVLRRVPRSLPHEDGALWGSAITHVLTPRLLFPEKPSLRSDSEMTMRYTGLNLASGSRGTSISMGYMAESYIDFGIPGMIVPIAVIGCLWGLMYRFLLARDGWLLARQATCMAVLVQAYQLEIHNVKLLGGMLTSFVVMSVALVVLAPRVMGWLANARR